MSDDDSVDRPADRWATFCLAVVASLLSNPPEPGELQTKLPELAEQSYTHPITGEPWTAGLSTIQRWYYKVRKKQARAMEMLRRSVRKDAGTHPSLTEEARAAIQQQYRDHRRWSYLLHWDNPKVRAKKHPELSRDPVVPDGPPVQALLSFRVHIHPLSLTLPHDHTLPKGRWKREMERQRQRQRAWGVERGEHGSGGGRRRAGSRSASPRLPHPEDLVARDYVTNSSTTAPQAEKLSMGQPSAPVVVQDPGRASWRKA